MNQDGELQGCTGGAGSLQWRMTFDSNDQIVIVETKGPIDKDSMPAMLKATVEFLRKHNCRLILADHRASELKMDVFETFNSPRALFHDAADWKNRAALVYSTITEDHRFMETVFVNNGRTVALFTDVNLARQWLISGSGTSTKSS